MKHNYEIAEMEIVSFEAEDVITTSGGGLINGGIGSGDSGDFSELFPGLT